jgi:hypothetical protein
LTEEKQEQHISSLVLETRQWDHKRGVRNPLFRMLTEQERMAILLGDSVSEKQLQQHPQSPPNTTKTTTTTASSSESRAIGKKNNNHNQKNQKSNTLARNRRRTRSFSENNHNQNKSNDHASSITTTRRTRSFTETYDDDEFSQATIHSIRNELERIRNSRTMEGSNGCTCRKLHVYLLPPNNAGKRAHHRRLKLAKVKDELKKRHALPDNHDQLSREQLELALHELVEREPCCTSHSECPCVAHGIECQADTCSCWYESHQTKDHQKQQQEQQQQTQHYGHPLWLTPEEITARCGNRYGTYVVDLHKIDRFRRSYLASGMATTRNGVNRNNENNNNKHDSDAMLYCTECAT